MHDRRSILRVIFLVSTFCGVSAHAEQTISAVDLFDKLRGMWLGQLIGNAAGRETEGVYSGATADPRAFALWEIKQVWDADDDTDIEYIALHVLESYGFDCNACEIAGQWLDHVAADGIYIANKQAWSLMLDGALQPATGSRTYNEHWYSIDAQIGTEVLGAVSPGLPQVAIDLAGRLGGITNAGFAVHAAQFYATMYAQAFFEPNVVALVTGALDAIPSGSRSAEVVADVLEWYRQDAEDSVLDWRTARGRLYDKYQGTQSFGRYYNWVESTVNLGATVLALLYGQGDFKETVQIAVLAGWDCDCNPATAGGLLGIIHGFSGLPPDLTDPAACGNVYRNTARPGLPDPDAALPQDDTITMIALRMLILAEENILRHDGYYASNRGTRLYTIPDPNITTNEVDTPATIGPGGLVGEALAAGIGVVPGASVERYDENYDRHNLYSIMDGVADNSQNGRKSYYTYVSNADARPQEDWYGLFFSEPVRFAEVTFYEGDIVWSKINRYYREDAARGGYFEDLAVQVLRRGVWVEPAGLKTSDEPDRFRMYQQITWRFAPTVGAAVRIIGTPGGSEGFTTILELQAEGELYRGPRVADVVIGDGAEPASDVFYLVIEFSDPVSIPEDGIRLVQLAGDGPCDVDPVLLFQTSSGRYVLMAFADFLSPGTYELRLACPAITDDFDLPLVDDDADPNDGSYTVSFDVAS